MSRMQLNDLMGNNSPQSWKRRAELAPYQDAIADIPSLGKIEKGGKSSSSSSQARSSAPLWHPIES